MLKLLHSRRVLSRAIRYPAAGCRWSSSTATGTATAATTPSDGDEFDVVLAGGGIMGSCAAYFLAQRMDPARICVVERDATYKHASTPLSVGGVRHQFSNRENVLMSMHCMDFIKTMGQELRVPGQDAPDVQFCGDGYLLLASAAGADTLRGNYDVQRECNAPVELLTRTELGTKFPWLNLDAVELGCFGYRNEGWLDPWSLLNAFRAKAISMGVTYVAGSVSSVACDGQTVSGVGVKLNDAGEAGEELFLSCDYLVNSAGPHAAEVAAMAGVGAPERLADGAAAASPLLRTPLPVKPRRRCVYGVEQRDGPTVHCPLVVDMSGAYIRREGSGGLFLCGKCPAPEDDLDDLDLTVDYEFFENRLWELIANRIPVFEGLKLKHSWAGYYEYNTFDQNGIIGRHPVISNFLFANGFSGHGLQQGPAVGRAISEVICDGASHSIDLDRLGFQRILDGRPMLEMNII